MPARTTAAARRDDQELVIVRILDAPRELVYQAWVDPQHVLQWWGPKGLTLSHMEMDVRPGGKWRKCMRSPEGKEWWRSGEYREVVPNVRLVFTYFSDDIHATPDHEMVVTVLFEKLGEKTKLTLRQSECESAASRDSHKFGWTSTLERLAEFIKAR